MARGVGWPAMNRDNFFRSVSSQIIFATSRDRLAPILVAFWKGNGTPKISGKYYSIWPGQYIEACLNPGSQLVYNLFICLKGTRFSPSSTATLAGPKQYTVYSDCGVILDWLPLLSREKTQSCPGPGTLSTWLIGGWYFTRWKVAPEMEITVNQSNQYNELRSGRCTQDKWNNNNACGLWVTAKKSRWDRHFSDDIRSFLFVAFLV